MHDHERDVDDVDHEEPDDDNDFIERKVFVFFFYAKENAVVQSPIPRTVPGLAPTQQGTLYRK